MNYITFEKTFENDEEEMIVLNDMVNEIYGCDLNEVYFVNNNRYDLRFDNVRFLPKIHKIFI